MTDINKLFFEKLKYENFILFILVLVVSAAFCICPIISNHWQLFDDGYIIDDSLSRFNSAENKIFFEGGRNFYFHGLYFYLIGLISKKVYLFYVFNSLFFIITTVLIFLICCWCQCSKALAFFSAMLFACSSVVPECISTLYKTEIKCLFFMIIFIYRWNRFVEKYCFQNGKFLCIDLLVVLILYLLGFFLGKELFVLVSFAWVLTLVVCVTGKPFDIPNSKNFYLKTLIVIIFLAGFVILLNVFAGVRLPHNGQHTKDHVTKYDLDILKTHIEIFIRRTPDILCLAILSLLGFTKFVLSNHGKSEPRFILINCMAFFTGYLLLAFHLVIWKGFHIYYFYSSCGLLALSLGLSFNAFIININRILFLISIFLLSFICFYSITLNLVRLKAFNRWDLCNNNFMQKVGGFPANAVVFLNYPSGHEFIYHFEKYLVHFENRPDLIVKSMDQFDSKMTKKNLYLAFNWNFQDNHYIGGRGFVASDFTKEHFSFKNPEIVFTKSFDVKIESKRPWFVPYDPLYIIDFLLKPSVGKELKLGKWIRFGYGWELLELQ